MTSSRGLSGCRASAEVNPLCAGWQWLTGSTEPLCGLTCDGGTLCSQVKGYTVWGWHLSTLIEGHTLLFSAFLSHTVFCSSLPPLSVSSPLSLSLSLSLSSRSLVTDPGGGWWRWHIVSLSPRASLFLPLPNARTQIYTTHTWGYN